VTKSHLWCILFFIKKNDCKTGLWLPVLYIDIVEMKPSIYKVKKERHKLKTNYRLCTRASQDFCSHNAPSSCFFLNHVDDGIRRTVSPLENSQCTRISILAWYILMESSRNILFNCGMCTRWKSKGWRVLEWHAKFAISSVLSRAQLSNAQEVTWLPWTASVVSELSMLLN